MAAVASSGRQPRRESGVYSPSIIGRVPGGIRLRLLGPFEATRPNGDAIDLSGKKIRALVGSVNFFDPRDGQVNGALAPRQPGSTLKPFIYGLGFEDGLIHPETLIDDLPLFSVPPPAPAAKPARANPALARLAALDPDALSPREALDALYELRDLAAKGDSR